VGALPDPDWYLEHVLVDAQPGRGDRLELPPAARWQSWWTERAGELGSDAASQLAIRQGFVASTGQLAELGWQPHDLRREMRRGSWSRPIRGVASPLVLGDERGPSGRRRRHVLASTGGALLRPDHVVSGRSAAITHGLPTYAVPAAPVLTTFGTDAQGRRASVVVRGASLDDAAVTRWFGTLITKVARTVVDLSRANRRDGLMAADAALREQLVTTEEISVELIGASGWPGVRQARDILSLASPLAESPLESIVRLALHDAHRPMPELQVVIGEYRVDFCWPQQRLILEADGREKYTAEELWREKIRETRLHALGYHVERILWADVIYRWPETCRRLRALLGL
jgi:very-short-patch-repair endonuclease